jgi:hypothetical protein
MHRAQDYFIRRVGAVIVGQIGPHVSRFDAASPSRFMEATGFVTVHTFATDFSIAVIRGLRQRLTRRPPTASGLHRTAPRRCRRA